MLSSFSIYHILYENDNSSSIYWLYFTISLKIEIVEFADMHTYVFVRHHVSRGHDDRIGVRVGMYVNIATSGKLSSTMFSLYLLPTI